MICITATIAIHGKSCRTLTTSNLKPKASLPSGLFDIGVRTRDTAFGFVFTGTLIVPEDGKYTFYLDSDDGSRLSVDGKPVIEYDGIHGDGPGTQPNGCLAKGPHCRSSWNISRTCTGLD